MKRTTILVMAIAAGMGLSGPRSSRAETVALLTFEEGSAGAAAATVDDSSGEDNDLSLVGVSSYAYTSDVGQHPAHFPPGSTLAGRFTAGANRQARALLTAPQKLTDNFTLECWYKGGGLSPFVLVGNTYPSAGFGISDVGGKVAMFFPGWGAPVSSTPFPTNVWTHFALTSTNNQYFLYMNGYLIHTHPRTSGFKPPTNDTDYLRFDLYTGTNTHCYDSVRLSNVVLPPEQFLLARAPSETVALYTFDEGLAGTTATRVDDSSNQNNDLALVTIPSYTYLGEKGENAFGWAPDSRLCGLFAAGANRSAQAVLTPDQRLADNFTLECWYKGDGRANGGGFVLVGYSSPPASGFGICNVNGYAAMYFPGWAGVASTTPFPTNRWTHFALTSTNNAFRLYMNRELIRTYTRTSGFRPPTNTWDLIRLNMYDGTNLQHYDSVRLTSRALDPTEFLFQQRVGTALIIR